MRHDSSTHRSSLFTMLLCAGWALAGSGCALPVDDAPEEASTNRDSDALAAGGSLGIGFWRTTTPMSGPRRDHAATRLLDGKVLVVGGSSSGTWLDHLTSAELFDPSTFTWSPVAAPLYTHLRASSTLLADGRVLVAGDIVYPQQGFFATEIYDPATDTWSDAPSTISVRSMHGAVRLSDGRVLLAAGLTLGAARTDAYLFDPVTGSWSSTGAMKQGRYHFGMTRLQDGRVLAAGGFGGHVPILPLGTAEVFNPQTGTWTYVGSMSVGRQAPAMALLQNGKVLVTGGANASASSVEIFDPATGTWAAAAPRNGGGSSPRVVTLSSGKVLAVGNSDWNAPSSLTELYDPLTNTWTVLDAMDSGRCEHTLTQLQCGAVLATGGCAGMNALDSVEILYGVDGASCAAAGGAP